MWTSPSFRASWNIASRSANAFCKRIPKRGWKGFERERGHCWNQKKEKPCILWWFQNYYFLGGMIKIFDALNWFELEGGKQGKKQKEANLLPKNKLAVVLAWRSRKKDWTAKERTNWLGSFFFFFPSWFSNYPSCELRFTTTILISLPSFLPSFLPLMQYFSPASTFIDWNVELESQGRDRKDGKETPSAFQSFHWKVCHWHQSKRARTDGNPISIQSNPSRLSNLLYF